MKYKAIVLDLDGTLMTSQNEISPTTQNLLIEIQKQGITVILASGRPVYGMLKASENLQLHQFGGYILAYNGCKIMNMKTREVIHSSSLEIPTIHELFNDTREYHLGIMAYTDDHIVTQDDDDYIQTESRLNHMPILRVPNFKEYVNFRTPKCLMTANESHLINVEKILKEKYHQTLHISRSLPFFLECTPKGIDKAQCLAILVDYLNLSKDEVIAIGDGFNDISMIEYAGLGVAMANGCEPILKKADYITTSNDQNGIAHVIEKFILKTI